MFIYFNLETQLQLLYQIVVKFTENNNQRFTIQDVIYTIEKPAKST